jgi:hypothetical protein
MWCPHIISILILTVGGRHVKLSIELLIYMLTKSVWNMFCVMLTVTNMVMLQEFEVVSDNVMIVRTCSCGNDIQKLPNNLYNYVILASPLCRMKILKESRSINYWQNFLLFWPRLWSSSQSFWLQIQRSRFDSQCYQIFWEVVGLKRGPLSLASTIEELLESKSSGSSLENREYVHMDQP